MKANIWCQIYTLGAMKTTGELIDELNKIKIEEFLEALDIKPIKREGNILTYNAPYDLETVWGGPNTFGKPTCLVDTESINLAPYVSFQFMLYNNCI